MLTCFAALGPANEKGEKNVVVQHVEVITQIEDRIFPPW